MKKALHWIGHMILIVDAFARRLMGQPSLRDLNTRIEAAEQDVHKSDQHAAYAEREIRRTEEIRDQNQIAGVIRHSLGIGYGDKEKRR